MPTDISKKLSADIAPMQRQYSQDKDGEQASSKVSIVTSSLGFQEYDPQAFAEFQKASSPILSSS